MSARDHLTRSSALAGIGLIMATALEHNGATVYIVGRRLHVLEQAAKENSVRCGLHSHHKI
jgi:NADP-dependent 3-hydroxy acid dehydrogenase YdfG